MPSQRLAPDLDFSSCAGFLHAGIGVIVERKIATGVESVHLTANSQRSQAICS
jgi:hypothetical protein